MKNLRRFARSAEEEKSPADDADYRRKIISGGMQKDRQEIKEELFDKDYTIYR